MGERRGTREEGNCR